MRRLSGLFDAFYRNGDITRLGASIIFIIFNLFMWSQWGR